MQNRFVQFGFSVAIGIAFLSVVVLGINVFIPHPDFNRERGKCYEKNIDSRSYSAAPEKAVPAPLTTEEEERIQKQEEERQACIDALDAQEKSFVQKSFAVSFVVGTIGVAVGSMLFTGALPFAASGMTLGGLLVLLYGLTRTFNHLVDRKWTFAAALFAFVVLLVVAWWRSRGLQNDPEKKKE